MLAAKIAGRPQLAERIEPTQFYPRFVRKSAAVACGHARGRASVMIEVRNDLIREEIGQTRWARLLAEAVGAASAALHNENDQDIPGSIGGRN